MRSDAEGNWVTGISLPSGRRRFLYINICRPVVPVSCQCTSECDHSAGMCATDVIDDTVVCCLFVIFSIYFLPNVTACEFCFHALIFPHNFLGLSAVNIGVFKSLS